MGERSFFSISYDLITLDSELSFDLFTNSSSLEDKARFVKVFKAGNSISQKDLQDLRKKYFQLYVAEDQRSQYMKNLVKSKAISDVEATNFIKDSAIKYLHQVFDKNKEFSTEVLVDTIHGCRDAVESMIDVLDDYNIDSLRGLIGSLSSHDFYTYDHSVNVSMYCIQILRVVDENATRDDLLHVGLGGLLHDLGKIKIPTNILNSPEGLTQEEYSEIKKHPEYGLDLLIQFEKEVSQDIRLDLIGRVINEHHENWDGNGYPNKLSQEDIHFFARICTIADFFDALTTKRSYNEVLSVSKALDVMGKFSGIKLDPKIFSLFVKKINTSKIQSANEFKLSDKFDPTLPYAKVPLEEIKKAKEKDNFGKIKVLDQGKKKKKK